MLDTQDLRVVLDAEAGLVKAIDGLSLAIERGETFALVGESGCGKSVTALALMRLLPDNARITSGQVRLAGDDLLDLPESAMRRVRGARIGIVFQEPSTSLNPVMPVGEQLLEALRAHTPLRGRAAVAKAVDWLRRVGLPEPERCMARHPFELSGGQKQRVMIAIALCAEPDLLIADEPTTALDVTVQQQILDLLQDLQRERRLGLLLITHDLALVAGMAHRVALMYAGQIVEVAPAEAFFARPAHPYATLLLQALPDGLQRGEALAAIPGHVPPLWTDFEGCRFAPRCPRAEARCEREAPALRPMPGTLTSAHEVRCFFPEALLTGSHEGRTARTRSGLAPASPVDGTGSPRPSLASVSPAAGPALLDIRHLSVAYVPRRGFLSGRAPGFTAVDDVSLRLQAGQTLALVGESGCGKTTLGRAVLQLLRKTTRVRGEALLLGQDLFQLRDEALRTARRDLQIVFQDPFASLNPRMRVRDILAEGMRSLRPEWSEAERGQRLQSLIDQVGLRQDALSRFPHEFSGGQRQRVAIARALAVEPRLLVCDEPTSALDVSVQAQILNLLRQLQEERGLAYLFITHNLGVVEYLADHVAVMQRGRLVESGSAEQVLQRPVHAYTRGLLAAVPRLRPSPPQGPQALWQNQPP